MEKKKILIVEDEPEMRMMLTLELETCGYEVFQAADGVEGFEVARKVKPDLIISDVLMPKMDGNELFKKIRAAEFGRDIPFIVLTVRGKMKDYFETVAVDDFLAKPFNAEELLAHIEIVLHRTKHKKDRPPEKGRPQDTEGPGLVKVDADFQEVTEVILDKDAVDHIKFDIGPDERYKSRPPAHPEAKPKKSEGLRNKKILIVENDLRVYRSLETVLTEYGFIVCVVPTPAKCFEAAVKFMPDVIITKYMLYAMKADKLVGILREMSHLHDIPIIVYSDFESGGSEEDLLAAGATCFVMNASEAKLLKKITALFTG